MVCRYYVYDFALPLLVIHALMYKTAKNLKHWMRICPRRQITVLDTHDGEHISILHIRLMVRCAGDAWQIDSPMGLLIWPELVG